MVETYVAAVVVVVVVVVVLGGGFFGRPLLLCSVYGTSLVYVVVVRASWQETGRHLNSFVFLNGSLSKRRRRSEREKKRKRKARECIFKKYISISITFLYIHLPIYTDACVGFAKWQQDRTNLHFAKAVLCEVSARTVARTGREGNSLCNYARSTSGLAGWLSAHFG